MNHVIAISGIHSFRRWGVLAAALLVFGLAAPSTVIAQVASAASVEPDQPADALVPPTSASDFTASQLDDVLAGSWRSASNRARDIYRHPKATLQFFGVRPDQTVIEITPGGGWYSEILAPLVRDNGHYIAAVQKPVGPATRMRCVASSPEMPLNMATPSSSNSTRRHQYWARRTRPTWC